MVRTSPTWQIAALMAFGFLAVASARTETQLAQGKLSLQHADQTRTYLVRVPSSVDARIRSDSDAHVALVLVLHGGGGNGDNAEKMTGFTAVAEREEFIVVYPEGTGRFGLPLLTWNAGHCCGVAMRNRVDDVGFIARLIDKMIRDYPVDPDRVYVTGMSNGAMMTHRLGIELSDKIAAIAPVAGTVFGDEAKARGPVSAIIINGLLDKSMPNQGGPTEGRFRTSWDGTPTQPAVAQVNYWSAINGCSDPNTRDSAKVTAVSYTCPAGLATESHLVKDNGHAWPGGERGSRLGDQPSKAFDATQLMWEFFAAHPKVR